MNMLTLFGAVDAEEIIKILVIILIFVIPAIGKLLTGMREVKRPGAPPVNGPRPPALPPQQMQQIEPMQKPQAQAPRPKSVKDEIEEFLRRAAQKKQVPSGKIPRRIEQPVATFVQPAEPIQAEAVGDRPVGGEVSEHVKKYLDETEFTQRASKFGGEVAAADKKREQHMQEVFGHGISKLAARPGETAAAPVSEPTGFFQDEVPVLSAAGTGLASILNNVNNLRQAIVINEILQRPVDRWK